MTWNDEPPNACAFVLLNVEVGSEEKMMDALKAVPEVKEAHLVYGVYDVIVRVESDTMLNLKDAINRKIRQFEKVRSTLTIVVTHVIVERKRGEKPDG